MVREAILSAAIATTLASASQAATYSLIGASGSDWGDSTKWLDENSLPGYPTAGDTALLHTGTKSWAYLDIKGGASVGSVSVRPEWDQVYRVRSTWAGQRTFAFDNGGADSVVTISSASNSASYTGNLVIGEDNQRININLANDLVVNNDGSRLPNGRFTFGTLSTVTGGSAGDRIKVTTRALGTGKITTSVSGAATFVGDWIVDGAATLDMNADSFGDASNSVDLLNGGTLDLTHAAFGSYSWTRSLSGTGKVLANANGFVLGAGSFDLSSDGTTADQLSITGNLILNTGSTLNLTGTFSGDAIPLLTTTGTITGRFSTVNVPAGYDLSYTDTGISLVVPEPGAVGLACGLGVLATVRRRRAAALRHGSAAIN